MIKTVGIEELNIAIASLQAKVQQIEDKVGLVTNIEAFEKDGAKETLVTVNTLAEVPQGGLVLQLSSEPQPAGRQLSFAGTGFVEEKKAVVVVYR